MGLGEERMRFAVIATYPHLSRILETLSERKNVALYSIDASFEEAAREARGIRHKVDAILSRGGTAEYIRRVVDIPVTSIPITPFDVADTVFRRGLRDRRLAFINFKRKIIGIRDIEAMFHIEIEEYTFIDRADIERAVSDAKSRGIRTVIGGMLAASLANGLGLEGIEIHSGEESVQRAFYETIRLVRAQREERSVAERLKVAFDSLQEGVVVTDEHKIITRVNTAAEKLLKVKVRNAQGKSLREVIPEADYDDSFADRQAVRDKLATIGRTTVVINHAPVYLGERFIGVVSTAEDITQIQNREGKLRKTLYSKGFLAKYSFGDILTVNPGMQRVKTLAEKYARTMSAVLIEGESGTGKEMLAQSIHHASLCAKGPFVAINCAAIPDQLLEAELFGYEPGAFTGARKEGKAGMFELAHGGTLFLDEIGEIPLPLQASLLRAVQEGEIMRIGGDKLIPVNVRILSATNKSLRERVECGEFRRDLYYRLSVFDLKVPPLRERREDVEVLTEAFLRGKGMADPGQRALIQETLGTLGGYDWPGNIRELQNLLERACLLLTDVEETLDRRALEDYLDLGAERGADGGEERLSLTVGLGGGLRQAVAQAEQAIVDYAMERSGQDSGRAMELLGIGRTTLWRKRNRGDGG